MKHKRLRRRKGDGVGVHRSHVSGERYNRRKGLPDFLARKTEAIKKELGIEQEYNNKAEA